LRNTKFNVPKQNGIQSGLNGERVVLAFDTMSLGQQQLSIVAQQTLAEALAPAINIVLVTLLLVVVMGGIAIALGLLSVRQIVQPIQALAKAAERIGTGDLTTQAQVTSNDEIGTLATIFNSMTTQLRDLIGSLEERVAARTKDLSTVAEVVSATATILETDKLLQEVVDLTKERFNLYHSHIYLLDEAGENLVLTAGAGEPGRIMAAEKRSIPLNREQSLVARAARERKGVTVNDVTQEPDFLPNPLLPNTLSELAVPMITGGNMIGVFDIQSDQVGRFTDSDISIQTTLAAQVSASIHNVRSFEQSKSQADFALLVNAIGQKIQRATTMEDTLQTAIRELGSALGATRVSANIGMSHPNASDEASRN
jgi:nitrate/nitrite-specific signal transduction histidine kinase